MFFLAITGAVGWKIIQRSDNESQKADKIVNYSFEPHFGALSGGCANYKIMAERSKNANVTK